ncbi:MAG: sigma-54-dependent transcriptional regulator [Myxococcota bacterium]
MSSILIVEDEAFLSKQLEQALERSGYDVEASATCADALARVQRETPDLVLLDLRLPDGSGLDLLGELVALDASLPVVMMTAYGSVADAVEAMRRGAADYVQKPLELDELRLLVERVLARQRRDRELAYHRERERAAPEGVIGRDPRLLQIFEQVERLRQAGLEPGMRPAILLTGETGTGKAVVARAIHEILGPGPFIEVNCTAMPAALVESELFGHERGTFTDAKTARTGLFEAAEGGTIFLDEIGHVQFDLQAKFLKVIEEKRIRRLGSTRDRATNVHVIAATNRDLDEAVEEGSFREDLLHRLRVLSFEIPPLRERVEDIRLLARHFCHHFSDLYGNRMLSAGAEEELVRYPWRGNVRELRNVIERACLLGSGEGLGAEVFRTLLKTPSEAPESGHFTLPEGGVDLLEVERGLIESAMERAKGNRSQAARLLGVSRDTLRYRLEKFDLRGPRPDSD